MKEAFSAALLAVIAAAVWFFWLYPPRTFHACRMEAIKVKAEAEDRRQYIESCMALNGWAVDTNLEQCQTLAGEEMASCWRLQKSL